MKTIKNLDLSIGQKNTKSDTAAAGKTLPFSSEIDLAFTQDDEDLNKIFTLRSTIYHKDLGFEVPIDQHDIKSLHLKVTHGELIIGCARLVPRSPGTLPLENQGFLLDDYLHKHQKCKLKIAEISRIAIVEDYRKDPKLLLNVFQGLYRKCKNIGIECIVTLAPTKIARMTAIVSKRLGYKVDMTDALPIDSRSLYNNLGNMHLLMITS